MRPDKGVFGCEITCLPQKFMWPKSRSWWSVCRLFGAALDCQGRDSGQITAGEVRGEGEMKYLGGSCSLFENRKLVFKSSSFLVFKLSVLRKVGKIIREMRPFRESEKGSGLGVVTRQLRCLFVLSVKLFVIDAASLGG